MAAALGLAAAAGAPTALAVPWCGTPTVDDRPPSVTGRSVRVVYVHPSDAPDRSAERAPVISADVDEIQTWWRTQDAEREPRFDRTGFACGLQVDLFVVRLQQDSASLRDDRFGRVADSVLSVTGRSRFEKHLVYYDGPVENSELCGQGGGTADGEGVAMVYLGACAGVPTAAIAAHELLHAFGALPDSGPPHACPDTRSHPCDNPSDLLYFEASESPLSGLALDVGRDDYYGHAGGWLDVQDSLWLRLVTRQVTLTASVVGKGSVESDVPGVDCAAGCATEWDLGSVVTLEALAGDGQRFVRWSGACTGSDDCALTLSAAQSVTALFAPERYGLVISLAGKGTVTGAGAACGVARCRRSVISYRPLRLRARAPVGWRFSGWSGGCGGAGLVCTLRMERATAVTARFVRR